MELKNRGKKSLSQEDKQLRILNSNVYLNKIFQAISDVVLIIDKNGKYLNVISSGPGKLVKPSEYQIGNQLNQFFHEKLTEKFLKKIRYSLKNQKQVTLNYNLRIRKKDVHFHASITPITKKSVVWIAKDITKQKLAEKKKLETNKLYQKLMENANDAIFITNAKTGNLITANKKAQELIGRSLSEIKKLHHTEIHAKNEIAIANKQFKAHQKTKKGKTKNIHVVHKNGNKIPVEITSSSVTIDRKKYIIGIFRDITEELKAKQELIEQESFFEQIYMQSTLSTQILDNNGWCERINKRLTELFGVSPENIEGKRYNIFKDPELIKSGVIKKLERVFKYGETAEWDLNFDIGAAAEAQNINTSIRKKKWFHNKAYPVFDNNKNIKQVVIHHEDITAKKQNEEKIKMLALSLENISECVSITDLNDKIIYVNDAFTKTYGYSREEISDKHINYLRTNDKRKQYEILPKTIEGGWQGELLNIKKDGTKFPIHLSTAIVRNEKKEPIALIGIASDITERKKQEALLKASEEKYRLLAEASQDMIFIVNRQGVFEYVNTYAAEQYNLKPEEIVGQSRRSFFKERISENQVRHLRNVLKTKEPIYVEEKVYFADKTLWMGSWLIPIFNNEGNVRAIMGIARNIDKRVKQEIELRKFSRAVEQSPTSIIITDPDGKIEYVNPKFTSVSGYKPEEVKGKNPRILKSGKTPIEIYKSLWETIASGNTWIGELQNKKKNGELFWEFVSISPITNKDGKIINYIAIKEDITDRKKAQFEIIAAKEKAEEMNDMKTKFLANMSHELRTPLIGVLGYAEILKNDLTNSEYINMANTIYISGKRLLHTLNLLLDLSRIEANKEDVNLNEVNVGDVVSAAVKLFNIYASTKNLQLEINIIKKIVAKLDERIFIQIINNLVNNAIKYTETGKIIVEVDHIRNGKDFILLNVKDTGVGIPEDKLEIIFEEFRQVSEGLNRRHQGTGLGLTITKKYVELLNGEISVKSKENKGSIFTVKLPIIL